MVLSETDPELPVEVAPGYAPSVMLDPRRMQRVLANVVENAEWYAGGATGVEIRPSSVGVVLSIQDRGPGVPPELRSAIFERYERGRATRDPDMADGTGLGLALASQHVRLHGGSMRVEANPVGGAVFVVELLEDP